MNVALKVTFIALASIVAVQGCKGKEEGKKALEPGPSHGTVVKKETVVVVPPVVQGKWKAVKIKVTDKINNHEAVYSIGIGSELKIPDSDLTIKVENFLPHFIMDGTTLTSQSNEPKNPAAQVRIWEGEKEIFKGWLFSLYPTTHAFQHPRYGFTLVDIVPAG